MTTTAIGFANKFYTLWQITEETQPLGNGHNYVITHFNYIKNISFDKKIALAQYPGAILDENLRGKTISWKTKKEIWENVDTFRFGKYKYSKIEEINDIAYTAWYWDNISDEDHKAFISDFMIKNGYEIRNGSIGNTYLVDPETIEIEKIHNQEKNNILIQLSNNEPIEFEITSNPDMDGYLWVTPTICIYFPEVKENWYNGFYYYLPVVNGKQKRIKNKTIIIDKYTFDNNSNLNIYIENFTIKK